MKELLEICGFDEREVRAELPRIERAFRRMEIERGDVETAKLRLRRYFELELGSVRMMLKIYLREMVRLALGREEKDKVVYSQLPNFAGELLAAAMAENDDLCAGLADMVMLLVYGGVFQKMDGAYEAGERCALAPESAHCSCNQAKLGLLILGAVPRPDLLVSWGIYCDEAWKTDEFIESYLGIPVVCVSRIQDTNWEEEVTERDVRYYAEQMRRGSVKIGEVAGREISDAALWESLLENKEYMETLVEISQLSIGADPVPLSLNTRLWAFLLCVLPIGPEGKEEKLNIHLKLLRQMKDVAITSKSPWMAACWVNYRNLYMQQFHGKDWCNRYLREITPSAIVFSDV
jgi:hypothetical protein